MAIRTVVTRGFGNGTFNGTIAFVVTRGYAIGEAVVVTTPHGRTLYVEPQNRKTVIEPQNRTIAIEPQNRKVLH